MVSVKNQPSFRKTRKRLVDLNRIDFEKMLDGIGRSGVEVLMKATPQDTGATANSWGYDLEIRKQSARLTFTNSVMAGATPLVILLRYGHGTGTGGYVSGQNFITPALKTIYKKLRADIVREVT